MCRHILKPPQLDIGHLFSSQSLWFPKQTCLKQTHCHLQEKDLNPFDTATHLCLPQTIRQYSVLCERTGLGCLMRWHSKIWRYFQPPAHLNFLRQKRKRIFIGKRSVWRGKNAPSFHNNQQNLLSRKSRNSQDSALSSLTSSTLTSSSSQMFFVSSSLLSRDLPLGHPYLTNFLKAYP